jgi:uncharacterized membrane protein YgcG
MHGKLLLSASLLAAVLTVLLPAPRAQAWPLRYFPATYPVYNAIAYQNALRLAAYQNALRVAAMQRAAVSPLYGLPPGLYPLALRRAALQRGANISWARQMATFQRMNLNRRFGGGSSDDSSGPAPSSDSGSSGDSGSGGD